MKYSLKKLFVISIVTGISATVITSCCKPGLGGNVTLIAYPTHHGTKVKWDTIYIKYKATTFPGSSQSDYDTKFIGNPNDTTVICNGLECGQYYFFARGYDSLRVFYVGGGLSVSIAHKDRNETKLLNIAVTE
jgi:hypothetical protein